MARAWIVATAVLGLFAWAAPASAATREELALPMDDGASIAATLYLPEAAAPPGGWPAVVLMHGLGGDRASMNAVAQQMGLVGEQYVVLTFDARGHGQSGGLIGIDGPREIADVRAVFSWLAGRADVADGRIGAWGISYGGGAALNSLVAGVPWAAIEVAETWTDLNAALAPQGLAKSGVIGGFLTGLPPARVDPAVFAVRDAAFAGRAEEIAGFAQQRSSLSRLKGLRTPVFLMQGRRDFAFGIDQATRAFALLGGPKKLWIGNHGHEPSEFPAADTPRMLDQGKRWFDRFLRGLRNGVEKPVVLIADEGRSTTRAYAQFPRTRAVGRSRMLAAARAIAPGGRVVAQFAERRRIEILGAPTVRVTATASGGWSRIVAVLSARTRAGREIVVSGGGVPARSGSRTYAIRLIDQATVVPAGSTLRVTIGTSSLAQNPANLLYLDLPMPDAARLSVRRVGLVYPIRLG